VSVLLHVRSTLEAADPRELLLIGHDERCRLADTLRAWALATDTADRLARADALLPPVLDRLSQLDQLSQPTHCKSGHPLTDGNVYHSQGNARCKTCQRESLRQHRARAQAKEATP
jgi:hypothetical protein